MLKLHLPREHPLFESNGHYDAGALAAYHMGLARQIAEQFDRRNANNGYMDMMAQI